MDPLFKTLPFRGADILLPKDSDLTKWSVVACDQYTSQPEYWTRVAERVGSEPSTLHLILPESKLEGPGVEGTIEQINVTMKEYLEKDIFEEYPDSIFYIERCLANGKIRRGLVGMVDLEQYDYTPGSAASIRATEGTVLSRIPPRVAVRRNALVELPHIMLLTDDPGRTVIEPFGDETAEMKCVYEFDMMEQGGHIAGWQLNAKQKERLANALAALADPAAFNARYGTKDLATLLFAVGDGNHSLATAKECYEQQKKATPRELWPQLPARYALAELVNLHDNSLEFEAIHRVVFDTDVPKLLEALVDAYPGAYDGCGNGHVLHYVYAGGEGAVTVPEPSAQLPVGTLQNFLDEYLKNAAGKVDYIHGEDVTRQLGCEPDCIGFLLPAMDKDQLFPTVIHDGVLPRKTFSMGEAHDKRFYLEARKIR